MPVGEIKVGDYGGPGVKGDISENVSGGVGVGGDGSIAGNITITL